MAFFYDRKLVFKEIGESHIDLDEAQMIKETDVGTNTQPEAEYSY